MFQGNPGGVFFKCFQLFNVGNEANSEKGLERPVGLPNLPKLGGKGGVRRLFLGILQKFEKVFLFRSPKDALEGGSKHGSNETKSIKGYKRHKNRGIQRLKKLRA